MAGRGAARCVHNNPLMVSPSNHRRGTQARSSFDTLRTSGLVLRLPQATAGDLGVFGGGLDEHPAAAVLPGGEGQGAGAAEGDSLGLLPELFEVFLEAEVKDQVVAEFV